jgi:hypothetical protein
MRVTFQKFFPWVWVAILLLFVSGYWMVFTTFGGFTGAGLYIHLMQMIGWLMIALFIWLFHGRGWRSNAPSMSRTGRAPAPASTASARSSPSTCRSACSSSSSAAVGATGANSSVGLLLTEVRSGSDSVLKKCSSHDRPSTRSGISSTKWSTVDFAWILAKTEGGGQPRLDLEA